MSRRKERKKRIRSKEHLASMIESAFKKTKELAPIRRNSLLLYKGECKKFRDSLSEKSKNGIEINLTKPVVDTMVPHLFFRAPEVKFSPTRKSMLNDTTRKQALLIEEEMNAIITEIKMGRSFKKCIKDAVVLGDGFQKMGLSEVGAYDAKEDYAFMAPYAERISPFDFAIDPVCRDPEMSDAGYIVIRVTENIKKFQKAKNLRGIERLKADGDGEESSESEKPGDKKKNPEEEYASLYEIWSLLDKKLYLCDIDGRTYLENDWPYDLGGKFPVSHIYFNSVPESFYCMGEPEYLEVYQLEMSAKRTQWMNHTRRFNRKYRAQPGISKDDKAALENGEDGTVIVTSKEITPIVDAPMSGDVGKEIEMIKTEVPEISGIDAYKKSQGQKGVYTATEADMIGNSSDIQIGERKSKIAETFADSVAILYSMLRKIKDWPDLRFNFVVDMSTMGRPDDAQRRKTLVELGNIGIKFPEFKRENYLREIAISLQKDPDYYIFTPEEMAEKQKNQPPDPEQIKLQTELQLKQMDMQAKQMEMQMKQAEMGFSQQMKKMEMQMKQMEIEGKMQQIQMESQSKQLEFETKQMVAQAKQMEIDAKLQLISANKELEALKGQIETQKAELEIEKMRIEIQGTALNARVNNEAAEAKLKEMDRKAKETEKGAKKEKKGGKKNAIV